MAFGAALKAIHTAAILAELGQRVKLETYASKGREKVKKPKHAREEIYPDSVAAHYAEFILKKVEEILYIVHRAEQMSSVLQVQNLPFVIVILIFMQGTY